MIGLKSTVVPAAATANLQTFFIQGRLLLGMSKRGLYDAPIPDREFRAHFGASPNVCLDIWQQCEKSYLRQNVCPTHHLWGLLFLKTYATEDVLAKMCGVTRKTFRLWSWLVLETIAKRKPDVVGSSFYLVYPPILYGDKFLSFIIF